MCLFVVVVVVVVWGRGGCLFFVTSCFCVCCFITMSVYAMLRTFI